MTSRIFPSRVGWPTVSDSTTIRSPTLPFISDLRSWVFGSLSTLGGRRPASPPGPRPVGPQPLPPSDAAAPPPPRFGGGVLAEVPQQHRAREDHRHRVRQAATFDVGGAPVDGLED